MEDKIVEEEYNRKLLNRKGKRKMNGKGNC
jgi:hypothetical protein